MMYKDFLPPHTTKIRLFPLNIKQIDWEVTDEDASRTWITPIGGKHSQQQELYMSKVSHIFRCNKWTRINNFHCPKKEDCAVYDPNMDTCEYRIHCTYVNLRIKDYFISKEK